MASKKQRAKRPAPEPDDRFPLVVALLAGSFAIAVNTALLALADAVDFTRARGGLLRLIRDLAGRWRHISALATFGAICSRRRRAVPSSRPDFTSSSAC